MLRSIFQLSWRLLLAFSLSVGPWPPAAWASLAPPAQAAGTEEAFDCHGRSEQASPAAPVSERWCADGCCNDPACDPSQCAIVHASLPSACATVPAPELLRAAPEFAGANGAMGPPLSVPLRPPIV